MTDIVAPAEARRLSTPEFIALMAMLFATIAFSIDAMLPALPDIAAAFSPEDPNRAQLVLTSFVLGMGMGTLVTGPLSDALGRKPVILGGAALYALGAGLAIAAPSLETLLLSRVLMGLGAAGPRVVALAIIRDLYSGRGMARIMSLVLLIFTMVPALAPTLGYYLILLGDWRTVFLAFLAFALVSASWLAIRQPETLPRPLRRPFRLRSLAAGVVEIVSHPVVALSIGVQVACFAMLFGTLSSIQQVFGAFGEGGRIHLWFAGIAVAGGSASLLNAAIIERLGMRRVVTAMLAVQVGLASCALVFFAAGPGMAPWAVWVFAGWAATIFFQAGMTLGNVNAMAMEPMGHIAGLAASVIGALATVAGTGLAVPVGLAFDGTPRPLIASVLVLALAALVLMLRLRRLERRAA